MVSNETHTHTNMKKKEKYTKLFCHEPNNIRRRQPRKKIIYTALMFVYDALSV